MKEVFFLFIYDMKLRKKGDIREQMKSDGKKKWKAVLLRAI
jgi:hypothetical protein